MSDALTAAEAREGLGNYADNGPPTFAIDAVDSLKRELAPFAARRDQFVEKLGKVQSIRTREDVGAAADLTGLARDVEKMVDAARRRIGTPHDAAVRAVNAHAADFWAPVTEAIAALKAKVDAFVTAEEQRIRDAEAEQRRVEAELRAARETKPGPPPPPPPAPIPAKRRAYRGDLGRQAIVQDDYTVEITDPRALPDYIFDTDKVREAIQAAVKVFRKQGIKNIPGVTITTVAKTSIRS